MKKSNLFLGVLFLLGISLLVFSQGRQREEVVQANFTESIHKGLNEKEKKELKNLVHELDSIFTANSVGNCIKNAAGKGVFQNNMRRMKDILK